MNIVKNLRHWQNAMLENINNYHRISEKLHTAAQPTVEQFQEMRQSGIEAVINLARIDSPNAIPNEAEIVRNNDMHYFNIPVDFNNPTLDDLKQFFKLMEQYDDMTLLVHCAYNWRVSSFIYLYRVIKLHTDKTVAYKDMLKIWQPDEIWQGFMDNCLSQADTSQ